MIQHTDQSWLGFALRDLNKPMDMSEFQFTEVPPDELKSSLQTVEEIEEELKGIGGVW